MNTPVATATVHSAHHQGSHRNLLATGKPTTQHEVDAIIVPTARPAAYLRKAIALASRLDCTLVALCSKLASPQHTVALAGAAGVDVLAIDVDELPAGLVPEFQTCLMLRNTRFERRTDTSLKRNLGLLLAKVVGWQRVVFLDDDISVPRPEDLTDAAGLLDRYAGVGLANGGYPDNSVVCHAFRTVNGQQDTFVGGGALAVGTESYSSFFPNIYNEDWFFLLGEDRLRPTAITGLAVQAPYDPFRDARRARSEELGDCLAEGVFGLLDAGKGLRGATRSYWREFLHNRRLFIAEVAGRLSSVEMATDERARMIAALKAAQGRSLLIEPGLCVSYLRAWQRDRDLWRRHLDAQGTDTDLDKALAELGLAHVVSTAA
ncbi:hypothetical protein GCM10010174_18150 [Kutzneria viridogrisea]|uniref:Glycosyl transferase family 2 n=1 Tax=Kutzneria viridogrisea TaxID=47990 RepID=A0ABR6B7K2_9PSEU|nr:hypothetical protein [Kutzneria viridogrisea]